ncbi:MAG: CSLREA domain-containing protein [Acidobacteria bacterium]|nr:CSLREA domain-containing protein [Acidobacteriota bacterium]
MTRRSAFRWMQVCVTTAMLFAGGTHANAATFVVNGTGDASDAVAGNGVCATAGGVCTLRAAIQEANALAGADTITFSIASGLQSITPASALPTISTEIDIDATTQPGFVETPLIKVVGTGAVDSLGFVITGANSSLRGLIIVGFPRTGVQVDADGVVVAGNYIGVTESGAAQGNGVPFGTGGVVVGLGGNYPNTIIGGTTASDRNVISGNAYGVELLCVSNVRVQGNYIGLDPTGALARPNLTSGVLVATYEPGFGYCGASGDNNVVGGDVVGAGNVVSGNTNNGIVIGIRGGGTLSGNRVQGNRVGLSADGTTVVANGIAAAGILVEGAYPGVSASTNTLIGGTTAASGNVLAGNGSNGHGIHIQAGSSGAPSPSGTIIQGNYVGLDPLGSVAHGFAMGILTSGPGTVIGGTTAGARNVVAGNGTHNILVDISGATIQGNYIGINAAGTAALGSTAVGVFVKAPNTVVGGTTPEARNVISGNVNGLVLSGSSDVTVTNVTVHGNYIGTDASGLTAVPNTVNGVVVNAPGFTVGGTGAGMGNLISGNALGVYLSQSVWGAVTGVSILGNRIGVNAAGNPLGNTTHGLRVDNGVSGAVIGGVGAGEANIIANNTSRGVLLVGGTGTSLRGNRIDANGSLGIDNYDTVLVDNNDALDADVGTNGRQNFPAVLSSTIFSGNLLQVQGTLDSKPNTQYYIDAYANTSCDALNHGEGDVYVGSNMLTTDGNGHLNYSILVPAVPGKSVITTTSTGPEGTSEFSQCRTAVPESVTISGYVRRGTGPGASALANVTMTLSGDASVTTVTDAMGYYEFGNLVQDSVIALGAGRRGDALTVGGNYTVTPSLAGFVFTPSSRSYINLVANQANQDFAGTMLFTISGQVRDLNDTGVANVTMTLSGGASDTRTTDLNGDYSFTLPEGATYTVTPSRGTFVFDPASLTFPNLSKNEVAPFFVAQVGEFTRYFAEGATSTFFDTRIALLNATGRAATAVVRFQKTDGSEVVETVNLDPIARTTVDPELLGLTNAEFSTVIESDQPVIADRTMRWDASGYGSHAETSIGRPLTQWYLAEGATLNGFDLFYLVQNPNNSAAHIEVRYLLPAPLAPVVKTHTVAARSRFNIWVNTQDAALASAEVSAVITSTNQVPVIVERAMYRAVGSQTFGAGHEAAGVEAPGLQWYFAEGATGPFLDLFFLIANPTSQAANVTARYLKPDGSVVVKTYQVPENSRFNIWVDYEGAELADTAVATTFEVTNGVGVVIERALWWGGDITQWYEGHNSAGAQATGTKWGLADGEVDASNGTETYILIGNTSLTTGTARVTLVFEDGTQQSRDFALPASSRTNVAVSVEFPSAAGKRFGAIVDSIGATPANLVVERAMFNDAGGVTWAAGSNAFGTRLR